MSDVKLLGVYSADVDALQSKLAALREELATAKRNEHNSEVAYKAAIEKQEELRGERNEFSLTASRLKVDNENYDRLLVRKSNQCDDVQQRLAAAEQRNAELVDCAEELADLVEASLESDYKADSFTTQPIRNALAALKPTESGASE